METCTFQPLKYGILPIPETIHFKSAMLPFIQDIDIDIKHSYLAAKQETKFAVLNVHTAAERDLFHNLMKANTTMFNWDQQDPDWKKAVKLWNSKLAQAAIDAQIRDPERRVNISAAIAATTEPRTVLAGSLPEVARTPPVLP
jgi:hypothetical protein